MVSELGVALIGCGGMGRSEGRVLSGVPRARLVAVCDVSAEAGAEFGAEMGVPHVTDHRALLDRQDVDAVLVVTPNGLHTQVVLDAAGAGKHIFCEKPFAFTVAECDQMISAAGEHGVRLMVGHVLRLMPLFQRVIDLFAGGDLGRPVAAQITRLGWLGTRRYASASRGCTPRWCWTRRGGKHIFCEKPFAFTVAECDQMISRPGGGVRLMVGHVLRLMPLFQRVIDLFAGGDLGRPVAAQITRVGWLGDPTARYRLSKQLTGGLLYDISVHEIDLLHALCGPDQQRLRPAGQSRAAGNRLRGLRPAHVALP